MFEMVVGIATITSTVATVWLLVLVLLDRRKPPKS
jgi:hypothetical protein